MENTIYNKPMYKCAICDAIYDTVVDRMNCEAACIKKSEDEARKIADEQRQAERNERKKEVEVAICTANDLLRQYLNDYGSYDFYCDLSDITENYEPFWPSRLIHDWVF